jgi:ribosomal protein S18 acetylase RimI-like enzyme
MTRMQIRPATPADAHAMAGVYNAAWRTAYRGILPDAYLDAMTITDSAKGLRREMGAAGVIGLVAIADHGAVVGMVTGGADRRRNSIYGGELFSLYVQPEFQRRGIGRRLVAHLAARLNRWDIYSVKVQVLAANPCRRFYEKRNAVLLACGRIRFADTDLAACTYGWLDTDLINADV